MFSEETKEFARKNKGILFLLSLWTFRLFFLMQRNTLNNMVSGYVFVQLFCELGLAFLLLGRGFNFFIPVTVNPLTGFGLLYGFGMLSFFWGVLPFMGTYFAFENLIMLCVLYCLAIQTKDHQQLEKFYIFVNSVIIWLFLFRGAFIYDGEFHSVAYSTVSGLLMVYCVAEYDKVHRTKEELIMLRRGIFWGAIGLVLSTSSGAMVSVAAAIFILAIYAKNPLLKTAAFLFAVTMLVSYLTGATDWIISLLFPGKSMTAIMTGHGRDTIWRYILEKCAERPWLGWGYASVERILPIYCTDAHNSFVGVLGGLGYVGCFLLGLAMLKTLLYALGHLQVSGMRGIFAASCCAFINSNTSNFLACQETLQALSFQMLLVLAAVYVMQHEHQGPYAPKKIILPPENELQK